MSEIGNQLISGPEDEIVKIIQRRFAGTQLGAEEVADIAHLRNATLVEHVE